MKPGGAPEGMEEGLVQEDGLHGVKVEVAHVHLEHLQALEKVEERDHL